MFDLLRIIDSNPYSKIGLQLVETSERVKPTGEAEPTLPRIPLRLLKKLIFALCKLHLKVVAATMNKPR